MKAITEGTKEDYQKAQVEALLWLEWLKKFARAYLTEDKTNSAGEKEG